MIPSHRQPQYVQCCWVEPNLPESNRRLSRLQRSLEWPISLRSPSAIGDFKRDIGREQGEDLLDRSMGNDADR